MDRQPSFESWDAGGPADFEVQGWMALLAPRGTPEHIIARVYQDVAKTLAEPDIRERLVAFGFEPLSMGPSEMAKQVEADSRRFAQIIKRSKISLD